MMGRRCFVVLFGVVLAAAGLQPSGCSSARPSGDVQVLVQPDGRGCFAFDDLLWGTTEPVAPHGAARLDQTVRAHFAETGGREGQLTVPGRDRALAVTGDSKRISEYLVGLAPSD